jgi:hypothetical protein
MAKTGATPGAWEKGATMRFKSVPLAVVLTLAAANTLSGGVALAQIPEAPGTFTNSNGMATGKSPAGSGRRIRPVKPKPTPNAARDTIDEMNKARARASGTPVPKSTGNHAYQGDHGNQ